MHAACRGDRAKVSHAQAARHTFWNAHSGRRRSTARPAWSTGSGSSEDFEDLDLRSAVMALETALASSASGDMDEDEGAAPEGLPVWCHNNAMLPGFREVLGVHEPWLVNMFVRLLGRPKPWRYVHFSTSSSFGETARIGFTMEALYRKVDPPPSSCRSHVS